MSRHVWDLAMRRPVWWLLLLTACGEPVLRNAPKPNPTAVAGVAAATAAAITLASPQTAAAQQEARSKGEPDDRGVTVKETVPGAVFDRLDQPAGDAGVDGIATPSAAPAGPGGASATAPASGAPARKPNHNATVPPPQAWTPATPPSLPPPPASR